MSGKKNSCEMKIPHPPRHFSNGPSLKIVCYRVLVNFAKKIFVSQGSILFQATALWVLRKNST